MPPSLLFCTLPASCLLGPSLPSALWLPHTLSLCWMGFVIFFFLLFFPLRYKPSVFKRRRAQSFPSLCFTSFHHTSLFFFLHFLNHFFPLFKYFVSFYSMTKYLPEIVLMNCSLIHTVEKALYFLFKNNPIPVMATQCWF